jgi:hypothetical protein
MAMSRPELLRLAQAGAAARVQELRGEIEAIYRSFPGLRNAAAARRAAAGATNSTRPAGRRRWTAQQRKAAAERMRKYWAARRGKK